MARCTCSRYDMCDMHGSEACTVLPAAEAASTGATSTQEGARQSCAAQVHALTLKVWHAFSAMRGIPLQGHHQKRALRRANTRRPKAQGWTGLTHPQGRAVGVRPVLGRGRWSYSGGPGLW